MTQEELLALLWKENWMLGIKGVWLSGRYRKRGLHACDAHTGKRRLGSVEELEVAAVGRGW
jgi:hypothetical protein